MSGLKRKLFSDADYSATRKEWEEILCPICMDHPHNAVLLRCTSHEKGCRSYICDTSYRHSNCLDRFKELKPDLSSNVSASSSFDLNQSNPSNTLNLNLEVQTGTSQVDDNQDLTEIGVAQNPVQEVNFELEWERMERMDHGDISFNVENLSKSKLSLSCPMCRGAVLSWDIEESARKHFNLMGRNCSQDSCSFFGNYQELRNHARKVHPSARPTHIDPSRQQAWRRLEHQRDFDDVVSAVRSAMPGAVVFGDYAIDSGDMIREQANGRDEPNGPLWSTLFLFQMIESANPDANSPRALSRARAWTRHRNSTPVLSSDRRRLLWGENLLGLQNDDDDDDDDEDEDDEDNVDGSDILDDISEDLPRIPRRRRRARLARFGSDNDQS